MELPIQKQREDEQNIKAFWRVSSVSVSADRSDAPKRKSDVACPSAIRMTKHECRMTKE